MAGEGLTAHHGEDTDNRADKRDYAADRDRDVYLRAGEEAWLEDGRVYPVHANQAPSAGWAAVSRSASSSSCPATTTTRPRTCSTSTRWPYRRVRTSAVTISAAGPLAARPPATYTTRSSTGS